MDQNTLRRVVAQNAETSRLLGVNFVPVYRAHAAGSAPADPPPEEEVASAETETPPEIVVVSARSERPPPVQERRASPSKSVGAQARDPEQSKRALEELRARYEREAPHQHFVTDHHSIVFGEGDPCARLMFVGEAPGAEEDRTGRPFVGRAGQLLDKMIGAMGLKRGDVYIANVLKTRPPNNATPTSEETRLCAPYLFEQIGIIRPEAIVALGLPATRALLDTADSMSRLRGRWARFHLQPPYEGEVAIMPTYHPAFLLRSYTAENRAKVWSDLQQVMTRLGIAPGAVPPA